MLRILRLIFASVVVILSIYDLITHKSALMPYMLFFLGVTLLLASISEFQLKRKKNGYSYLIVSLFIFLVSIQGFLLN
ncbi:DUF3953 domain-containing protein [Gottfriedia acidiceleris]|uniref:DUF3953 domain-containing protein n=1 Tax=Bacillaceae TaxID=186817 RepID=UPI000BED5449|nr:MULTISPECIES: DUF3953 domain-containing protein [unclassified Bacillus (in: firmicutes)]PEC47335.1 hypothetical protein CON00_22140 [Bacillus sp. AFS096315]PFM76848.1 hypothetical protein COJ46_19265 [Bacillus sp. AFS077874]